MSCTSRKMFEKACVNACLLFSLGGCILGGCASALELRPDFARDPPRVIAVLPVRNETIHQLDKVSFGGLLQRAVIGAPSYDIPDLLRGSVEEALMLRGYQTAPSGDWSGSDRKGSEPPDFKHPLPPGAPSLPFNAVLYTVIESWSANTMASMSLAMRYRLELYRVPSGELLLSGKGELSYREDARTRGSDDIPSQIRQSAQRTLSYLPRVKE